MHANVGQQKSLHQTYMRNSGANFTHVIAVPAGLIRAFTLLSSGDGLCNSYQPTDHRTLFSQKAPRMTKAVKAQVPESDCAGSSASSCEAGHAAEQTRQCQQLSRRTLTRNVLHVFTRVKFSAGPTDHSQGSTMRYSHLPMKHYLKHIQPDTSQTLFYKISVRMIKTSIDFLVRRHRSDSSFTD